MYVHVLREKFKKKDQLVDGVTLLKRSRLANTDKEDLKATSEHLKLKVRLFDKWRRTSKWDFLMEEVFWVDRT